MDKYFIVDRFEEGYAVLETPEGEMITVNKDLIEEGVKVGDSLIKSGDNYKIDMEATIERKNKISNLMKGLWE